LFTYCYAISPPPAASFAEKDTSQASALDKENKTIFEKLLSIAANSNFPMPLSFESGFCRLSLFLQG
jgi:hypothetical protein